jgi:hypothetical protein
MNKIDESQYADINKSLTQSISRILMDGELNDEEKLHLISKAMQVFDKLNDLIEYYKIIMRNKERSGEDD